jgi:uncharacterized repeat protein (TIGR03803 family)
MEYEMTMIGKLGYAWLFCAVVCIAAPAQKFQTIASFDNYNGAYPQYVSLIQGAGGNFYGTTFEGGEATLGTLFEVTAGGEVTTLCSFGQAFCYGGDFPYSGLAQDAEGNFYGTTWQGGTNKTGAVYEFTTTGTLTVLYNFCSQQNCTDGDDPYAPLVQASNGDFYGTTLDGGTEGYGTVFAITSAGTLTTLHSFGYKDGAGPVAGLIQAENGNFYGTTLYGGAHGAGTVYEINSAGMLTTLHSFGSKGDGANPYAGLVQGTDGNFYGTTYGGGAHGHGAVFEITATGELTTLYSFCSQKKCVDGAHPYAGIIQATNGNFYGTASLGGTQNRGTLYQLTPAGALSTMHSFCTQRHRCTDGAYPSGGLLQATDGTLYGTTTKGGPRQAGTVFSLSLAADPAQPSQSPHARRQEERAR